MGMAKARKLVADIASRHGITEGVAARLAVKYIERAKTHHFCDGWWLDLLDAQFQTHIGPYKRIRCGDETELEHLIPESGNLCHDCGCSIGEYHVFNCDSEECSHCGEQAFCCECDDGSSPSNAA